MEGDYYNTHHVRLFIIRKTSITNTHTLFVCIALIFNIFFALIAAFGVKYFFEFKFLKNN